ncbi:All-trans-nonaprenyl-diphosphate synthase (geranyl-diphosphate specific) [Ralstonia psammae]|uniref:All-trans-nonaprenyl-diphosphate synthase (Geranyl-diphosphate specific) n=1 Tax=Ralstonia psammae TaxID=3058598 RepID=A0ABN9JGW7_9RALS|nr:polyprenyl synthetase family protein [Ralstonia sp. LMG 19083]CAJ0808713.1 All-trans-nonaprenyl-diphosphate synthase (geranyl-diphosphate specific) [Ralstonia sp. LMG 19083]
MVRIAAPSRDPVGTIIQDLMAAEMQGFEHELARALEPQHGYLTDAEMALYRGGKKLRPLTLLLTARLFRETGELPHKVLRAAASLEMLHVASLIHDDIVDHATLRRGQGSVNAARGTEMAILIGDMQFLQAVRCFVDAIEDQDDMELVKWVLDSAFDICRGEIDEMTTQPYWHPDALHARYLTTIDRKTAVLFGLACEAGAALMRARTADLRRLGAFGRHMGRAFQMMDDILDLSQSDQESGKCKGLDLHQRRMTLPIIHAMKLFGDLHPMVRYLRGTEPAAPEQINAWVDEVRRSDAFALAYAEARNTALQAVEHLQPLPESPHRRALHDITMFIVNRSY